MTSLSRRAPARRLRQAAFLAVPYGAFALALLAVELGVRAARPPISTLDFFVTAPEQQAQMVDAARRRIFEGDPLLAWRLMPGLREVVWDQTPVTTNALGLRYDAEVGPKRPGTFRILCLGDSVTFGFRVPLVFLKRPQERHPSWRPYPARMEALLREANPGQAIEVLPLAVPGYSSHQGLAWLRRDVARYRPDVVTLLFGWNDISLRASADHQALPATRLQVEARSLLSRSQALMRAWRLAHGAGGVSAAGPPQPRVAADRFVANHLAMVEVARQAGAAVAVVGPVFRDSIEHPEEARRIGDYRRALRAAMEARGVAYVEVPELTEAGWPQNEPLFLEHIHPNHAGHRVLARALLASLARHHMLGPLAAPPPDPAPAPEG